MININNNNNAALCAVVKIGGVIVVVHVVFGAPRKWSKQIVRSHPSTQAINLYTNNEKIKRPKSAGAATATASAASIAGWTSTTTQQDFFSLLFWSKTIHTHSFDNALPFVRLSASFKFHQNVVSWSRKKSTTLCIGAPRTTVCAPLRFFFLSSQCLDVRMGCCYWKYLLHVSLLILSLRLLLSIASLLCCYLVLFLFLPAINAAVDDDVYDRFEVVGNKMPLCMRFCV